MRLRALAAALFLSAWSFTAFAQETKEPLRTRVGLGPQVLPKFPGSDEIVFRPFVDVSRARGDEQFEFEAADESFGFSLLDAGGFQAGPVLGFESKRTAEDVGANLPTVKLTVEVGAFAQYRLSEPLRVRAEVRRGVGGHKGWVGTVSADYIARDRDEWLFAIGPRVTFGDDRYHQAYFGVSPAAAATSGLPAFSAGGGLQALGVNAGFIRQLSDRWGIYTYARYDRLVDDAADSPIVRRFGSRDQYSGGLALTYTFGRGRSSSR
jgi:outer membrane protein